MPATASKPTHTLPDRRHRRTKLATLGVLTLVGTAILPAGTSGAATDPGLGTAAAFAVLGAGTVTNTGPTVVNGDLGVHPGDAVTGFGGSDGGPGIVNGAIHAGDATAADAHASAEIAYGALAAQACDEDRTDQDLGGLTLTAGVYCFSSSAQLTGPLTLNAVGDPDAVFIFRIGTTLTTASSSSVEFTDGFASCNVFWQVGSAATLGTDTDFVGTVIARTEAITANTGARVNGRLLALNAAVTLDSNVVTASSCATDETPVDETPVDGTPVDGTPVDGTPVDGTPVADTPVDDTPVADTPVADTPVVDTTGAPAVPSVRTWGPSVPSVTTSGPGVPGVTGGPGRPAGPRPSLPVTGSGLGFGCLGLLAIVVGAAMVRVADTKLMKGARSPRSAAAAPAP